MALLLAVFTPGALLGASPVSAADALPVLAATTVVSGSEPTYVDVHLPQPVNVDWETVPSENTMFSFAGGGRLAGVFLRQLHPAAGQPAAIAFATLLDPATVCSECPNEKVLDVYAGPGPLPPGDYRLTLLTDGAPTTVTLNFADLEGSLDLSPVAPVAAQLKKFTRRDPVSEQDHVAVHGAEVEMPGPGMLFAVQRALHDFRAHTQTWSCHYEGGASHPLAYYPECPKNDGETSAQGSAWLQSGPGWGPTQPTRPHVARLLLTRTYNHAARYGYGTSVYSAAVIKDIGAVGVWIPYGP